MAVPIEKEVTRIDKNGEEITKHLFYRLQFVNSGRFVASSLSNLVNKLSEEIHSVNTDTTRESVKHAELNINNPTIFLNTQKFKMI